MTMTYTVTDSGPITDPAGGERSIEILSGERRWHGVQILPEQMAQNEQLRDLWNETFVRKAFDAFYKDPAW